MTAPRARVAVLLFGSGACSLVYETVWLRELRLVFGASTMASAAVVACFVGGLGAGGLLLGKRADAHRRPLALYGNLELGIAASAAVTPLLLLLVRAAYVGVGGTSTLGALGGTLARLLLAAVVFAVPTLLMGGTLPAVARAVERDAYRDRRDVALLYGFNTLGAVTGCLLSTFVLLETFGNRLTLWVACLVNLLVAVAARSLARRMPDAQERVVAPKDAAPREAPVWAVLVATGAAGFAFCLMELVWYRMLGPLLGGSVFSFGLILAVALLGIGLGATLYAFGSRGSAATLNGLAWTCLLEALFVAAPYALGDRLAVMAARIHPGGHGSFWLQVGGWCVVTAIVVLPAALASGAQFPLLIGLLGKGSDDVGRDVGRAYATSTLGAIAGSLAGGFGLVPALGATGCWRAVVWMLVGLGGGAVVRGARRRPLGALLPALVGLFALLCLRAEGPTSAWRHSPIGAGRVDPRLLRSANGVHAWENARRRAIEWQVDGRESSVAIDDSTGVAFVVNGKNDGNACSDASTAVMAGMVGALLHPHPTRAMVIGLGTGESAGWLAAIGSVEDVDVAELEPAILEVARQSEAASHGALESPKVHVNLGDAREILLTSPRRYDLVVSEPSNPYRAGVASLFTQSYYEAIAARLDPGGLFLQWLQGYEVDATTVQTVYETARSVFPEVETWELGSGDLLLVGSKTPIDHDFTRMRARLATQPYRSAAAFAWSATTLEEFLAHFVASSALARQVATGGDAPLNTDDRNLVEFGFARSVGSGLSGFSLDDLRAFARQHGMDRPQPASGDADWARVDEALSSFEVREGRPPLVLPGRKPDVGHRVAALAAFLASDPPRVLEEWSAQPEGPVGPIEAVALASALAEAADERARPLAEAIAAFEPADADAILARLRFRQGRLDEATSVLESFFARLGRDPWPMQALVDAALATARDLAVRSPALAGRLYASVRSPFALHLANEARQRTAIAIALRVPGPACAEALASVEPSVPWDEATLKARLECYRTRGDALASRAQADLDEWHRAASAGD